MNWLRTWLEKFMRTMQGLSKCDGCGQVMAPGYLSRRGLCMMCIDHFEDL